MDIVTTTCLSSALLSLNLFTIHKNANESSDRVKNIVNFATIPAPHIKRIYTTTILFRPTSAAAAAASENCQFTFYCFAIFNSCIRLSTSVLYDVFALHIPDLSIPLFLSTSNVYNFVYLFGCNTPTTQQEKVGKSHYTIYYSDCFVVVHFARALFYFYFFCVALF